MESFYEINVARDGRHYFATAPRSATTDHLATMLYYEMVARFPVAEGYAVTVTHWEGTGRDVTEWVDSGLAARGITEGGR